MIPEQPDRRNRHRGHANILGLTPVSWSVERLGSGFLIWWHVALPFRDIPWFGPWQSHSSVPTRTMLGLLGAAAIVFSAVAYSLGSVVARPLTKTTNATFLSGLTMLLGGLMTIGAWAFKPGAKAVAWFDWSAAAWWLAVPGDFGSLLAFTTYLRLIAAWGPARAGSYTYVFPVFAVLLGVVLLHENFGLRDGFGMSLLLVAAFCSLRTSVSTPARPDNGRIGSGRSR
ncbi:MAG: EamA family transporter [Acetobacteraceae bacterium]